MITCNYIYAKVDSSECEEFWLPRNIDWEFAYDDVTFSHSPMIFKCEDSTFNILFPVTLTLHNDTININQEMGYQNKCVKIGKMKVGESKSIDFQNKNSVFKIVNNTIIEFNGIQFEKLESTFLHCTCCDW